MPLTEKNKWKGKSCTPNAAWHSAFYLDGDPNAWMYDINKHNGWGAPWLLNDHQIRLALC